MEPQRYLDILAKYKWIIVVTTLTVVATVGIGSLLTPPTYSASALVRIAERRDGAIDFSDINYTTRLINTYVQLLKSRPFVSEVSQRLGLSASFDQLASAIRVEPMPDTELIQISAESQNPKQAVAIANTLAELLVEQGQKFYSGQGKSTRESLQEQLILVEEQLKTDRAMLIQLSQGQPTPSQSAQILDLNTRIKLEEQSYTALVSQFDRARIAEAIRANAVSIAEPAAEPRSPSRPRVALNLLLGTVIGLIGGVALSLLFYNFSPTVRGADDLALITSLPLLATIPITEPIKDRHLDQKPKDGVVGAYLPVNEAVRALIASVFSPASVTSPRLVLVTSADAGLAKSTLVANLALALARSGQKVIVVGADPLYGQKWQLTRKMLESTSLKIEPDSWSSPSLHRTRFIGHLYATQIPNVSLLMRPLDADWDQVGWVDSLARGEVIERLAQEADVVLFDGSPMLLRADSMVLAPLMNSVIVVVDQDKTPRSQVAAALKDLGQVNAQVLGVVLNSARVESEESFHLQPKSYLDGIAQGRASALILTEPERGRDKGEETLKRG